ncbi:uncharacterized protein LOC131323659 [Rhododendron vialii]|uniref:uncharacterized protein LOC131323659 n=1 Tax=Rhododendron vialii TaxID=182163 RepID=UPI00265EEE3E|nr:uncharacterized protein LOC131323659 [Rhododendron vialii]
MAPNRLLNLIMNDSDFSDSDDELEIFQAVATYESERDSSSSRNRRTVTNRNTFGAQNRLFDDYFAESPVFPPHYFRRRFRMSRSLFLRIHDAVKAHEPYFIQKRNAAGKLGLSSLQKMTAAFRMLAYGAPADSVDEYVRIGATTALESLRRFLRAVIDVFSEDYLRSPNAADVARLLAVGELREFPGMLGSLDCMHWEWKNCPTAWQDRSSLFDEVSLGRAPPVNYTINGNEYNMGCYLVDGIYPQWASFVKTIPSPQGNKKIFFAQQQESTRKDVERAFGVLQARFAIVRGPGQLWDKKTLKDIMLTCIILHNMIIEDERDYNGAADLNYDPLEHTPLVEVSHERTIDLVEFIRRNHQITDRGTHSQLQADLIEHLWQMYGQS